MWNQEGWSQVYVWGGRASWRQIVPPPLLKAHRQMYVQSIQRIQNLYLFVRNYNLKTAESSKPGFRTEAYLPRLHRLPRAFGQVGL